MLSNLFINFDYNLNYCELWHSSMRFIERFQAYGLAETICQCMEFRESQSS